MKAVAAQKGNGKQKKVIQNYSFSSRKYKKTSGDVNLFGILIIANHIDMDGINIALICLYNRGSRSYLFGNYWYNLKYINNTNTLFL